MRPARRRAPARRPRRHLPELAAIEAELDALPEDAPDRLRAEIDLRKWRLIHRHLRAWPFVVDATQPREEQWRRVLDRVRDDLDEREMVDWLRQQAQIAGNLARGIRDLRPRKDGPCYDLLLEFVANRKRKALAVLHWILAAAPPGAAEPKKNRL